MTEQRLPPYLQDAYAQLSKARIQSSIHESNASRLLPPSPARTSIPSAASPIMSLGLEEFAAAIGVQLPQDENMMSIVEQLFSSELPEGWTQHRSSKGTVYVLPFPIAFL
jgi:hypothetical protein